MIKKIFLSLSLCLILQQPLSAEPWLSNRYAQNCAGCHAPGRANRVPKERRCTLSCQGCHTNPNGGGMRNQYGVWNSQRWLRSKYTKKWKNNKPTPAPYAKQVYAPLLESYKLSTKKHKKLAKKYTKKEAIAKIKKNKKRILKDGYKLKTVKLEKVNLKDYDKHHDARWKYNTSKKEIDWASATKNDPIRLKEREWLRASFDARLFYISAKYTDSTKDFSGMSIMNTDLGLEIKPFAPNWKFVFETRYGNSPMSSQWDTIYNGSTGSKVFTKSAYLLVDDLPYNIYAMYGLFRPMFGYYDPNHTSLAQEVNGLKYNGVVKGISLGTAPNVPFFNLHLITPKAGTSSKESGLAANIGARFVTVGASAVFSYWKTKVEGTTSYDREMWSMNLGGQFGKSTINADLMRFDKIVSGDKNGGTVTTVDLRQRLWKENYFLLNFASSNVAKDLSKGSATDTSLGFKSYILSGLEWELLVVNRKETKSSTETTEDYLQSQLHVYF